MRRMETGTGKRPKKKAFCHRLKNCKKRPRKGKNSTLWDITNIEPKQPKNDVPDGYGDDAYDRDELTFNSTIDVILIVASHYLSYKFSLFLIRNSSESSSVIRSGVNKPASSDLAASLSMIELQLIH